MDRQIVLDVNLGFGNDYDLLNSSESNTILSFLNKKIAARKQLRKSQPGSGPIVGAETACLDLNRASSSATQSAKLPEEREEDSFTHNTSSSSSSGVPVTGCCQEKSDFNTPRDLSMTKKPSQKATKYETSLLSAVSTSDDEDLISHAVFPSQTKNSSIKRKFVAGEDKKSTAVPAVPTFRFLNFKLTPENWVMYTIEISQQQKGGQTETWKFESRYSLLKIFEERLTQELKDIKLPEFPGKKWFGNLSDEFIKERMITIERFMNAAFRNSNAQKTTTFKEFIKQSRENCIDL